MTPVAIITGISGQDGSYLAELLLSKGYIVHGLVRRTSSLERSRISHLYHDREVYGKRLFFHYFDLGDATTLRRVIQKLKPGELYHLAGQTHVGLSFEIPEATCDSAGMGTLRLLEILRDLDEPPKFFHPTSSEIFGNPRKAPQNETTPMDPLSPYGCAKAFATQMVRVYRRAYGFFAWNGILYNHESPRRGENFVTRKICRGAAEIKAGRRSEIVLGRLDSRRDWGDARDVVRGIWLAMQEATAEDYVFATGRVHTLEEILAMAFGSVGLSWRDYTKVEAKYVRPADPQNLVGDATKARERLGWKPRRPLEELIREMTLAELDQIGA